MFESELHVPGRDHRGHHKSPSVDRPVVVFTSLEAGLAKLSAEDEAKYLAMVSFIGFLTLVSVIFLVSLYLI